MADALSAYAAACKMVGAQPVPQLQEAIAAAASTRHIERLELDGTCAPRAQVLEAKLSDADVAALCSMVGPGKLTVSELALPRNRISDAGAASLARALPASGLVALDLRDNDIGPAGCRKLVDALKRCPDLAEVRLDGNPLGEEGGAAVAELVATHPQLRALSLSRCELGANAIIHLSTALYSTASLAYLDISEPRLSSRNEESIGHVGKALRSNTSLRTLCLRKFPHLSDAGVASLVDYMLDNASLVELDLSGNRIAAPGAAALARALEAGAHLQSLTLAGCRVGDEGAAALAAAITSHHGCALAALDLRSNSIGDAGLAALASAVAAAPQLAALRVAGNHMPPGAAGTTALGRVLLEGRAAAGDRLAIDVTPYVVDGVVSLAEQDL
jgi:Ran GTPase-activating protein (RanGAP) involved in mRNA processing and transport